MLILPVTNCPARHTPVVVTSTVALYTTYCPVGSSPTPEANPKYTVPPPAATATPAPGPPAPPAGSVTTVTVYNNVST